MDAFNIPVSARETFVLRVLPAKCVVAECDTKRPPDGANTERRRGGPTNSHACARWERIGEWRPRARPVILYTPSGARYETLAQANRGKIVKV